MKLCRPLLCICVAVASSVSCRRGLECAWALPKSHLRRAYREQDSVEKVERTRLRAAVPVVLFTRRQGQQAIEHLNVLVNNVGGRLATQVEVIAELPDGISYVLRGPRRISAGQRCLYSLSGKRLVVRVGIPKITTSCAECAT